MIELFNKKSSAILLAVAAISLGAAPAALAHHSFAMYDNGKELELEGVVKEFRWTNPHGEIVVTATQAGRPVDYSVELSSPNVMSRQGWTRKSLIPGERIKVTIHPLKDGTRGGSFMRAVKADGSILRPTAPP